jgi:signal transduction histidine kinase
METEKIQAYIKSRWFAIVGTLLIFAAENAVGIRVSLSATLAPYVSLTAMLLSNLLLTFTLRRGWTYRNRAHVVLVYDLFFICAGLYFAGGPESTWWFLPIYVIFNAGYYFNIRIAIGYATLASLFMVNDFWLEYYGLIPHWFLYSPTAVSWRSEIYLTHYMLGMFLLYFGMALASGYFYQALTAISRRLAESLRQSEDARRESDSTRLALLNVMSDLDSAKAGLEAKIQVRTTELEQTKADLEIKVKERTIDLEESRKAILHMMKNLKDDIAKLQVLDRMKTEFLSMVSHELRTPLTPIKGYLSLLTSGKMGTLNETQRKALDVLTRQSEHLHSLIDSILDLSRIELGKSIPISREPLSIRTVIEETVDAMNIQATEKQIKLEAEIQPDLPTITGDVIKLKRVLANLVGNALKFSPEQGTIKIQAYKEDSTLRVAVSDQGAGIAAENLPHLFEKFYQVDSSITRAAGGMGMGLPIAKELVELHGGRIWLESGGLGQGTRAIFTIPVV